MIRTNRLLFTAAFLAWCATLSAGTAAPSTTPLSDETSALLSAMPAKSQREAGEKAARLVKAGRGAILEVIGQLTPPGEGDDSGARYMLDSLTWHVSRPGAEEERRLYAEALIKSLDRVKNPQVKAFLLEQLGRVGKEESVAALGRHLTDPEVGDDATRALLATGAAGAADEFVKALPEAKGRVRLAIIHALGDLRARQAADALVWIAAAGDPEARQAALYALAGIGAPQAPQALDAAASGTTSPLELGKIDAWRLLYARRIAESGQVRQAAELCRRMMAERQEPGQEGSRSAALGTLVDILRERALNDVIQAARSDNPEVRKAALHFASRIPGEAATSLWVAELEGASAEVKGEIIAMLGRRGDKSALPVLLNALKADDLQVRLKAITAAANLGGKEVLGNLLEQLTTDQKDEIDAIRTTVLQFRGDDVTDAIASVLAKVSDPAKTTLLDILAARQAARHREAIFALAEGPSRTVRTAAFKALDSLAAPEDLPRLVKLLLEAESSSERSAAQKAVASTARRVSDPAQRVQPLLAAYDSASTANKESILATFAGLGGEQALEVVKRETTSTDPQIRTAAIRALSQWSGEEAMPELLNLFKTAQDESHHVLAGRGYVRLLDESQMKSWKKLPLFAEVLKAARRAEEKRLVLASLADIRTTDSLKLTARYLDDQDLKGDAALSALKIALPRNRREEGLGGPEVAQILIKAIPLVQDADLRKKGEKHVNDIYYKIETSQPQADAEGFVPLFDGQTLAGWTGSVDGYTVEDGVLVCLPDKGGNLYTARTYDDFILRFAFKLTPGANNGLGIRAPLGTNAAYEGMELQILDDDDPKYKDLQPYQYHGSIYGVVPAKRGHLKPDGEWNEQEVTAKGGRITVKLNGEVIVDADVSTIPTTGTMDGKAHPGLHRREGHIGFLGHGSRVEFRDIRIKELHNEPPPGFVALFNGKDLSGWKGLVENPIKRAAMSPEELAKKQEQADQQMRDHWKVVNGVLVFDGQGSHLCTEKHYGDFEMLVDWKMFPGGDSGIYLRGTPQVQIWDPAQWKMGSGGLYNNQKNTSSPLVLADRPLGEWNTFHIRMVGDRVTIHLNDKLIVDNVPLENYWDRSKPIFPREQIELQAHGSPIFFRNVFLREL